MFKKGLIGFGTVTLFFICLGTAFSTEAGVVSCYSRIDPIPSLLTTNMARKRKLPLKL